MPLGFRSTCWRIDEIAEVTLPRIPLLVLTTLFKELANGNDGPKKKLYDELLELCTRWRAVPALYELRGVVMQEECAQNDPPATKIQKGMYRGEAVVLRVLRLSPDSSHTRTTKKVSLLYSPEQGGCLSLC